MPINQVDCDAIRFVVGFRSQKSVGLVERVERFGANRGCSTRRIAGSEGAIRTTILGYTEVSRGRLQETLRWSRVIKTDSAEPPSVGLFDPHGRIRDVNRAMEVAMADGVLRGDAQGEETAVRHEPNDWHSEPRGRIPCKGVATVLAALISLSFSEDQLWLVARFGHDFFGPPHIVSDNVQYFDAQSLFCSVLIGATNVCNSTRDEIRICGFSVACASDQFGASVDVATLQFRDCGDFYSLHPRKDRWISIHIQIHCSPSPAWAFSQRHGLLLHVLSPSFPPAAVASSSPPQPMGTLTLVVVRQTSKVVI